MTRNEALIEADKILEDLLRSGDKAIFGMCRLPDGSVDEAKLVAAAIRARERLADEIMNDSTR